MTRSTPLAIAACWLIGALLSQAAGPASPPLDDAEIDRRLALHHTENETVRLVMLPVTVSNRRGRAVRGLSKADFSLTEETIPQEIRYFSSQATEPISIAFLLDLSGSMRQLGKLDEAKESIRTFVDNLRPGDRFGLIGFADEQVTWITDFTEDREDFLRRLDVQRAYGPTALFDAVGATPGLVDRTIQGRKAIVLITDGVDNASSMNLYKAMKLARQVDVPIYTVGFTHLPAKLQRSGETVRNLRIMKLFARETGGRVYAVRDPDDLKEAVIEIEEELRHQYLIGYHPSDNPWDGSFRRVKLDVKKNRLNVRTRRGYYAEP